MSSPTAITFDCYGTLIDWEKGIKRSSQRILGEGYPVEEIYERWRQIELDIVRGPYMLYRDVLKRSLEHTLGKIGLEYRPSHGNALVEAVGSWSPFADVRHSLSTMRQRGYKLAIISNIDNDILAKSLEHIGVPFDALITAENVRVYKPSTKMFETALRQLNLPPEKVMHVGCSILLDIKPAAKMGIPTVLVRRSGRMIPKERVKPDVTVDDLGGLLALL